MVGIRILRGRGVTLEDQPNGRSIVVVSESVARVPWPNNEALGQCIRVVADSTPYRTVVGVAANIVTNNFQMVREQPHFYYLPREQLPTSHEIVLLRMRGDVAANVERVRRTVQGVMPGASYVTARPLQELVDNVHRPWRLGATAFISLGLLAFLVAAVGLTG